MLVMEKREGQVVFHLFKFILFFGVADIDTPQVEEGNVFFLLHSEIREKVLSLK